MATIELGGSFPNTLTLDQKEYVGESLNVKNAGTASDTPTTGLTINNSTNSNDVLTIMQTGPAYTTFNLNLGSNANVEVLANYQQLSNSNYQLEEGATLNYIPPQLQGVSLEKISFDLGESGSSTLIFDLKNASVFGNPPQVKGLTLGDQIQVTGASQGAVVGNHLVFRNADGDIVGRFDAGEQDLSKVTFDGGTMNYACYLKGTHIATPEGEVKVETLKAGDKVLTANSGIATVKWLGQRTLYKSRIPAKDAVRAFPILFKKDSIAPNVPHRNLMVSPGHHISFDGTLVPAMMLVNGQTIVQQFETKEFEYFHVELDQFDIILAEGVPAESYVDTGNRSMFHNSAEVALNPDFGPVTGRPVIEGIKVVQQGPIVEAIRRHLLSRAEEMTDVTLTTEAGLCIEANGQLIQATPPFAKEGVYRFVLPENSGDVQILSRSATVRDVSVHARRDIREIGVGLSDISIYDNEGRRHMIDLQDPSIEGLHPSQEARGTTMRWTNGHAIVPASLILTTGKSTLELTVLCTYQYWGGKNAHRKIA